MKEICIFDTPSVKLQVDLFPGTPRNEAKLQVNGL